VIAKQLLLEDYAVIGNLYSPTRGIGPLIRNFYLGSSLETPAYLENEYDGAGVGSDVD
jgi:hypothetical protein